MADVKKCPVCKGSGKYEQKSCHGCNGKGWVTIGATYPTHQETVWPYVKKNAKDNSLKWDNEINYHRDW